MLRRLHAATSSIPYCAESWRCTVPLLATGCMSLCRMAVLKGFSPGAAPHEATGELGADGPLSTARSPTIVPFLPWRKHP